MKYDFTSIIDRHGKDAVAVDTIGAPGSPYPAPKNGFTAIPLWAADMNFPVAPSIQEALIERTKHPLYGYFSPSAEYYNSIIRWQETHNDVTGLKPQNIGYENGVIGGVINALNVFCSRGDTILLHSPTYVGFTGSLTSSGYKIVHSPLFLDEQGIWRMNFEDMEQKIIEHRIHATIFCSPHNPCGRVWERWEVEKAMEIYQKHDVMVVSDEIWSDIIRPGCKHVPTQSVSEDAKMRTVALYAPSKTFNLSGLVGSYHIIYNKTLIDRCAKESSLNHYNMMNVLSMHALIGAYKPEGYEWHKELCQVIADNIDFACDYIDRHFDGVEVSRPQGTYLLFINCEKWCKKHGITFDELLQAGWDVGVVWRDGRPYHVPYSIRMTLALPLSQVQEAFERLDKYVFNR